MSAKVDAEVLEGTDCRNKLIKQKRNVPVALVETEAAGGCAYVCEQGTNRLLDHHGRSADGKLALRKSRRRPNVFWNGHKKSKKLALHVACSL